MAILSLLRFIFKLVILLAYPALLIFIIAKFFWLGAQPTPIESLMVILMFIDFNSNKRMKISVNGQDVTEGEDVELKAGANEGR